MPVVAEGCDQQGAFPQCLYAALCQVGVPPEDIQEIMRKPESVKPKGKSKGQQQRAPGSASYYRWE